MIKELYKFTETRKNFTSYEEISYFTSSEEDQDYNGNTYVATVMGRGMPTLTSEVSQSSMRISFEMENAFAKQYLLDRDTFLNVECIEFETSDSSTTGVWKGRMVDITADGKTITINFESIFTSLRRYGLNRVYSRSCGYNLFDAGCTLDSSTFAVSATCTDVANRVLTVGAAASYDDHYFTYGVIEDASGNSRFISRQLGDQIIIAKFSQAFEDAFDDSGSFAVTLYPGCSKTRSVCETKFNNLNNFGGFPLMRVKNPFEGSYLV